MKHEDAPKSKSVWVHVIMDLPPLIVMGNKKQGACFEGKVGSFYLSGYQFTLCPQSMRKGVTKCVDSFHFFF
jgi:hypothetical protein